MGLAVEPERHLLSPMKTRGKIDEEEFSSKEDVETAVHPEQLEIKRKSIPELEVQEPGTETTGKFSGFGNQGPHWKSESEAMAEAAVDWLLDVKKETIRLGRKLQDGKGV